MFWYIGWLVVFLVAITGVGIFYSTKIKTADDYVMADFSLGFFPICGSFIATSLGSAGMLGGAGRWVTLGNPWCTATMPYVITSIVFAVVVGATIGKLKWYAIPDLFVRRFGESAGLIPAVVIGVLFMAPT